MGAKHPGGLGQPTRDCWPEVWHINEPIYDRVWAGRTVTIEDGLYPLCRGGAVEDLWLTLTYSPLRDATGAVAGILVTIFETTQRVLAVRRHELAVARLRESEARFRHMADSAPVLIWMTDPAGQLIFANMHYDHMFGRPAADMLGDGWMTIVQEDDLSRFHAAFQEALQARQTFRAEVRVRDAAGAIRWLRCEGVPRLDDAGRFLGYTGCGIDITEARLAADELERRVAERTAELMAAEETLRQAQKMEALGQLTGGIAHDFNNMLQGVVGGLAMARRQISAGHPERTSRYLDAAHGAAERAASLTKRLLAFARNQRLDPKPVEASALIAGLAEMLRRTMGPGIEVDLRLRNGNVLCDPHELENALLNLCINARDAMPEGGRLTVATAHADLSAAELQDSQAPPGRYVAIVVTDTGTGMPPEVLKRVFDPFFTTKPVGQGTGLGLSQVYGFVRQSGGIVQVESMPGQGTTFRLLLPFHGGTAATAVPPAAVRALPASAEARAKVLLVDDEAAARRPMADRLRELGYDVFEAVDGPGALRILASVQPDLLVTDVGLPGGMNGRQVAEAVRERFPGLPVLFISGYSGAALPAGVEVIGKPFDLDMLALRIGALLAAGHGAPGREPGA
ncbi:ATP-binding protein [Roseicella sp. DB1501]|uniref:ATP-binding protein n=1 Tax=Roseicella sp. DB1501 TaxID=2730925 RepID=UPI0014919CF1|nr:ATP-binding protein [Roseicella sp. DB1501]NOG71610.1 PAS domain S-box protein [Roseicella sp. DB1501]